MTQHLLQYHSRVQCDVLVIIPSKGSKDNLAPLSSHEVFDRRPTTSDLSSKQIVEYLTNILARFKIEAPNVLHEMKQKVGCVCLLRQLSNELGLGVACVPV